MYTVVYIHVGVAKNDCILSMQVKWACFIFFWIFEAEKQRSREAEKLGKSRSREAEKQRS